MRSLIALALAATAAAQLHGRTIHPNGQPTKCLGAANAVDGGAVTIQDCSSRNTKWLFYGGCSFVTTYIRLDGTDLCAEIGSPNSWGTARWDGSPLTLAACNYNAGVCDAGRTGPGTLWVLTIDYFGTMFRSGMDYCLDNENGRGTVGNKVQIWSCHKTWEADAANQKWQLGQ